MDISEHAFEGGIVAHLHRIHGYRTRLNADYDKALCLDWELLLEFITATQPDTWRALERQHGPAVKDKFLKRLTQELARRGTLDVLRRGIKDYGCYFHLAYFPPASNLNPEHRTLYGKNILSVLRQCRYSTRNDHAIDLALFLNGLPIITAELKNQLTGQNVSHARQQYRDDREPKSEPLLQFKRCLVHFAMDDDEVAMTTRLQGQQTQFLPFNRGVDGGAGNPHNSMGYASAYLWEEIWQPDNLLELIGHFIHLEMEDRDGQRGETLIFPRYHQRDAVRALIAHAQAHGHGHSYLIQHSAGSGKSNSIAWLAHRLATLHNAQNRRVFDSVIVVTDRRVLDQQLQSTIRQFEQTPGVVNVINKHSEQLAEALEGGADIIVSTLQKFPVIVGKVGALPGKRFAVVVDEAHSSQTGEASTSLKTILQVDNLEEAEQIEAVEATASEDLINRSMAARGRQPNLSFLPSPQRPSKKRWRSSVKGNQMVVSGHFIFIQCVRQSKKVLFSTSCRTTRHSKHILTYSKRSLMIRAMRRAAPSAY